MGNNRIRTAIVIIAAAVVIVSVAIKAGISLEHYRLRNKRDIRVLLSADVRQETALLLWQLT